MINCITNDDMNRIIKKFNNLLKDKQRAKLN